MGIAKRLILLLCFGVWHSPALAVYVIKAPDWNVINYPIFGSADASCADYSQKRGFTHVGVLWISDAQYYCRSTTSSNPEPASRGITAASCSGGYSLFGSPVQCRMAVSACPEGTVADGEYCRQPSCFPPINLANTSGSKAATACISGCAYDLGFTFGSNGGTSSQWIARGETCDGTEVAASEGQPEETQADSQCQQGTCRAKGEINGTVVDKCVPCNVVSTSTDKTGTSETTTQNGETTTTTTAASESTSQTTCTDGRCTTTTTTTTTNSDGEEVTTTETFEQDKGSFCEENPSSQLCKTSSWGGGCGNFSCDGDAVQCAIAQASWKSACAFDLAETDPQVQAGQAAATGGLRPADHPANNPQTTVFSSAINQTNPYGGGCPADVPIDVMGQSFSIPLSHACSSLQLMGQVVVLFSLIAAAYIVFGGIKG